MSEYAQRDFEGQGEIYVKHVSAMIRERLHSKDDIAAELAYRDLEIQRLKHELGVARRDERRKVYAEIKALVKKIPMQGNGSDQAAERNGLILALNTIRGCHGQE